MGYENQRNGRRAAGEGKNERDRTLEDVATIIVDDWVSRFDACERAQDGCVESGSELFTVLVFAFVRLGIRIARVRIVSLSIGAVLLLDCTRGEAKKVSGGVYANS